MKCANGHGFRAHEHNCPVCDEPVGYPNVRAAEQPEELRALAQGLRAAEQSAKERGCEATLEQFRLAMQNAHAVICMPVSRAMTLVSDDSQLYGSYYNLVNAGVRRPEESDIDQERQLADSLLFSHYRDFIRFGALSLDGRGVASYGHCSIVLKEDTIRRRATVFEKNSVSFCRERGFRPPLPLGYRASWDSRSDLAISKLAGQLSLDMAEKDFAGILIRPPIADKEPDFIEVHIYGPLHRLGIESIKIQGVTHPPDRPILMEIARVMHEDGIHVELE